MEEVQALSSITCWGRARFAFSLCQWAADEGFQTETSSIVCSTMSMLHQVTFWILLHSNELILVHILPADEGFWAEMSCIVCSAISILHQVTFWIKTHWHTTFQDQKCIQHAVITLFWLAICWSRRSGSMQWMWKHIHNVITMSVSRGLTNSQH